MKKFWHSEKLIEILQKGGVTVMPTDTIYGIVGRAENESTVNRIYAIRKRHPNKPCIILIGDMSELTKFSIELSPAEKKIFKNNLVPTSIVLDCNGDSLKFLHRGTKTLAFRIPKIKELRDFLMKTGPLIAPSANTEGLSPAKSITEAQKYFGDQVDLYIDAGKIRGRPSKIIQLHKDGSITILRP